MKDSQDALLQYVLMLDHEFLFWYMHESAVNRANYFLAQNVVEKCQKPFYANKFFYVIF